MKSSNKYLIFLSVIYLGLFITKKSGWHIFLISDYAADLFCLPLSLLFYEYLKSKWKLPEFKVGGLAIFVAVIYFSIVFEVMMPSLSRKYTADIFDVVCYAVGGIFYYFVFTSRSKSLQTFQPA